MIDEDVRQAEPLDDGDLRLERPVGKGWFQGVSTEDEQHVRDDPRYGSGELCSALLAEFSRHQPGDRLRVLVGLLHEGLDHLPASSLRVVLRQLPLPLQPGDLDAKADDRLKQPFDVGG